MTIPIIKLVSFKGELVQRRPGRSSGSMPVAFRTDGGLRYAIVQNPSMVGSMQIGTMYHIRGREYTMGPKTYLRISTVNPVSPRLSMLRRSGKAIAGGTALMLLVSFIGVPFLTHKEDTSTGESKSLVETMRGSDGNQLQNVLDSMPIEQNAKRGNEQKPANTPANASGQATAGTNQDAGPSGTGTTEEPLVKQNPQFTSADQPDAAAGTATDTPPAISEQPATDTDNTPDPALRAPEDPGPDTSAERLISTDPPQEDAPAAPPANGPVQEKKPE